MLLGGQSGVEAVMISCGSRGGNIVDKSFIATEGSLKNASVIFCSPEVLTHTPGGEKP